MLLFCLSCSLPGCQHVPCVLCGVPGDWELLSSSLRPAVTLTSPVCPQGKPVLYRSILPGDVYQAFLGLPVCCWVLSGGVPLPRSQSGC